MIWPLLHRLFGWDYISWTNSVDYGVARIHKSPDGTVWYWQYKNTRCIAKIPNHHRIVWLTCSPDKYLAKHNPKEVI